jgi:hypothetical protein
MLGYYLGFAARDSFKTLSSSSSIVTVRPLDATHSQSLAVTQQTDLHVALTSRIQYLLLTQLSTALLIVTQLVTLISDPAMETNLNIVFTRPATGPYPKPHDSSSHFSSTLH